MKKLLLLLALAWCGAAHAQSTYLGDYLLGDTVRCPWSTYKPSTGDSIARATAGTVTVYADNGAGNGFNTTESATGVTDTSAFDAKTGEHQAVVVASSGNGYAAGKDYAIMVQSTTITDTATVTVNAWPCNFSVENRAGTRDRIKARGSMVSGSSTTVIQLATGTLAASHAWQGMALYDATTKETATICDSTDGGAGNDTLTVSGLFSTPGATDAYQIIRTDLPASCIASVPGSGLPLINASTGAVVMDRAGQSGASSPAISDKTGLNLNALFDNGGIAFVGTIATFYNAATGTFTNLGTPVNMGSGASIAANLQDAIGIVKYGQCDVSSTTTVCNYAGLTEPDGFWNNWTAIEILGQPPRCVREFAQASHRLSWPNPSPSTAASQYFVLRAAPECRSAP
jgi:hypothetical protein